MHRCEMDWQAERFEDTMSTSSSACVQHLLLPWPQPCNVVHPDITAHTEACCLRAQPLTRQLLVLTGKFAQVIVNHRSAETPDPTF